MMDEVGVGGLVEIICFGCRLIIEMGRILFDVLAFLIEEHIFELDVLCQKLLIELEGFFQIMNFRYSTD